MIKTKQQMVDSLLLVFTIIVGIISYILNLGWLRIICVIPFLAYNSIMLISGIIYVLRNCNKEKTKQRNIFYLGLLTYILFNVFLCDCADIGSPYCFFGLIEVHGDGYLFSYTSMISLIINLICIVLNIIAILKKRE